MKRYLALHLLFMATICPVAWSAVSFGSSGGFGVVLDVDEVVLPDAMPIGSYVGEVQVAAVIYADSAHSIGMSFDGFRNIESQQLITDNMTLRVNEVTLLAPGQMEILCGSDGPTPLAGANLPLNMRFCIKEISRFTAGRYQCIASLVLLASP